jgi:hypothetical protein
MSDKEFDFRDYGHTMAIYGTWMDIPQSFRQTIIPKKEKYICKHCFTIMQVDADFTGVIRCGHCGAPVVPLTAFYNGE